MGPGALSYVISVIGAFVALTAATLTKSDNTHSAFKTLMAGIALGGVGVWSMYFIGMLALSLDVATSFSMVETGTSLAAAILAVSLALGFVARAPKSLRRMLGDGLLLGSSVAVMHDLGMYGMKVGGYIQWDFRINGASLLIAVVASTAALWLAFNTVSFGRRLSAALVMAVAVCAMHDTGTAAAECICTTPARTGTAQGFGYIPSFNLVSLVTMASLTMVILLGLDQFIQRTLMERPRTSRT